MAACAVRPVTAARDAAACATAPMIGDTVHIADEAALIVWDPTHHIEHFIRRATFATRARDFGFLVPTPTRPELAAADEAVFFNLDEAAAPEVRVEHRSRWRPGIGCLGFFALRSAEVSSMAAGAPPVRVLDEVRVAGYDAVVLEADDPAALAQWLTDRHYATTPTLTSWLTPYVAAHWKITAFRVASPTPGDPRPPGTSPVRMTFSTERPFYPYREPDDQRVPGLGPRTLRVHVVAPQRMEGTVGDAGRWPGEVQYAAARPDLASRMQSLSGVAVPAGWWLTTFDDRSSPRPGTDEVYLRVASSQAPRIPPPVVVPAYDDRTIPVDWIVMAGALGAFVWRRARRRRAA